MTNEQREAIELAKEFTKMDFSNPMGWTGYYDAELEELSQAIETVLSLIKEQQEKVEKKDKIINEMIEEYEYNDGINIRNFCDEEIRKDKCIENCTICMQKYFERKVEDVKD